MNENDCRCLGGLLCSRGVPQRAPSLAPKIDDGRVEHAAVGVQNDSGERVQRRVLAEAEQLQIEAE